MNKMQIVSRNIASLTFSQFASLGISFISSIFVIRYLGVAQYGEYSLVITLTILFGFAIDLGLSQLVIREISKDTTQAGRYFSTFFTVQGIVALLFYALLVVFVNISHYPHIIRLGAYIAGAGMVIGALVRPFSAFLTALQEMHIIALVNFLVSLVNIVFVIAIVHSGRGLVWLFIMSLALSALSLLFFYLFSRRFLSAPWEVDRQLIRHLLVMTIPFALLMIFNIVYGKVDVFLISKIMKSDTAIGLYSSAYRVIDTLVILPATISSVLFPIIARNISDQRTTDFVGSRAIKFTAALGLPIAFGALHYATPVVTLLFGKNYASAGHVLQILIWMIGLISSYSILGSILLAANKVRLMVILNAIGIVVNVGLNIFLIRRFGIIGAAASSVGSEVLITLLHAIFARRFVRFGQLRLDFLKILIASGLMLGFSFLIPHVPALLGITLSVAVYFILLFVFRFIQPAEYDLIKEVLPVRFHKLLPNHA